MFAVLLVGSMAAPLASGMTKFLGNVVASSVPSGWDNYWDQATAENGCKWEFIEGS
jgi:endo-1,4-beta-xylanase